MIIALNSLMLHQVGRCVEVGLPMLILFVVLSQV
jgi:hypothetical protein